MKTPGNIALIQFDTRPLSGYWNASAVWNKAYALYHGHKYAYLTINEQCSKDGYKLHSGRVTNLLFFLLLKIITITHIFLFNFILNSLV